MLASPQGGCVCSSHCDLLDSCHYSLLNGEFYNFSSFNAFLEAVSVGKCTHLTYKRKDILKSWDIAHG